jgi:hypothetical protein
LGSLIYDTQYLSAEVGKCLELSHSAYIPDLS